MKVVRGTGLELGDQMEVERPRLLRFGMHQESPAPDCHWLERGEQVRSMVMENVTGGTVG